MQTRKKTLLITYFFFILTFKGWPQDNTEKKTLTAGIKLLPGVGTIYNQGSLSELKFARFSFSGGIDINKEIKNKMIYLESGIFVLNRGIGNKGKLTDDQGNVTATVKSSENLYYLQLPLIFKFKKKWFFAGSGPTFNYYIARKYIFDGKVISTERTPWTSAFLFGTHLNSGFEKELTSSIVFSSGAYLDLTFGSHFLNYGVGMAIRYKLN